MILIGYKPVASKKDPSGPFKTNPTLILTRLESLRMKSLKPSYNPM